MGLPTNIVDAAAAIRDGEFGLIEEIKIGDLLVSALTGASGTDEMIVTEKPVEAGYTTTDAAIKAPIKRSLDIVLANPDYTIDSGINAALSGSVNSLVDTWREKRKRLYQIFEAKELVTLQTHEEVISNMLITSISPMYDVENNLDAFVCNVTLQEIRLTGAEEEDDSTDVLKKAGSKGNAGKLN